MILKIVLFSCWILVHTSFCTGNVDIPFFDESSLCSDRIRDRDDVPYFEFDAPSYPFDKRTETVFYPDLSTFLAYLRPFSSSSDQDIQQGTSIGSSDGDVNSQLRVKKRSVNNLEDISKVSRNDQEQYEGNFLTSLLRENRNKDVKTIQLPSSFIPRLGRKRSEEVEEPSNQDNYLAKAIMGRARVIDLKAGNAFTPRLGRSEGNKVHLLAGNAFTPRLGRSDGSNRISFNAGSAFTPRLGRSEGDNRIHLNAGSAFTPRLGRSEGSNRIQFNAGSAFTPRLGRSEGSNRIHFNAGSAFTPRLGRSEGSNRIQFNAGSAFTPRLGRSEQSNRIHFNAGSAFTPRLGRSEDNRVFYAGSSFTPRLGRSESDSTVQLNVGSAFTPRLG